MKIIAGLYRPDTRPRHRSRPRRDDPSGTESDAVDDGRREHLDRPRAADAAGARRSSRARRRTATLLAELDIDIDPDERICDLTIAARQMVEIARAVSYEADILIMDEPTSTLVRARSAISSSGSSPTSKPAGSAIIYITHKINEVFRIADEVIGSARRAGGRLGRGGQHRPRSADYDDGRPRADAAVSERQRADRSCRAFREALSLNGTFSDVSFDVRAGEILGIARPRRLETHRGRGDDVRPQAARRRRRS